MPSFENLFEKRGFLAQVFATLIAQLLVTFLVVYFLRDRPDIQRSIFTWYSMLILFLVMLGIIFAIVRSNMSFWPKFLLFTVFSVAFGMILSPIAMANREVLLAAAGGTLGIFVFMFIAGAILTQSRVDLSMLGAFLVAALIGLIVSGLVFLLFDIQAGHVAYVTIGLVVYSLFVMYDTQVLLIKQNTDVIGGAMQYYLDILGIFVRLVELMQRN